MGNFVQYLALFLIFFSIFCDFLGIFFNILRFLGYFFQYFAIFRVFFLIFWVIFFQDFAIFDYFWLFWQSIKYWIFWVQKVNIFVGSSYDRQENFVFINPKRSQWLKISQKIAFLHYCDSPNSEFPKVLKFKNPEIFYFWGNALIANNIRIFTSIITDKKNWSFNQTTKKENIKKIGITWIWLISKQKTSLTANNENIFWNSIA